MENTYTTGKKNTANTSIECTVKQCEHHCENQNYCSLNAIRVVTHEQNPTEVACTDCSSFKAKQKA
ncbi:MAG: DUF1540 domain-containing protein [Clostridia bacterium]|nr:DUF1540 domain-containing protein [Clostridia bacterium]